MARILISGVIMMALLLSFVAAVPDTDGDGIIDTVDNCPTIRNSGQLGSLNEGQTQSFTVNGVSYQVTLDFVNATQVRVTLDGQSTSFLQQTQFYRLPDHTRFVVREIMYQDYAGGIHAADFYLGGQLDTNEDGRGDACPNRAPSISASNQMAIVGQQLRFNVSLSDPDDDVLHFYVDAKPSNMDYVQNGATTVTFTWTPTVDQIGQRTVEVRVVDDGGLSDTDSFTVTVSNPSQNQQAEWQRFNTLEDEFQGLEDDFVVNKRNYERTLDRNNVRDIREAKDDLKDLDDDLANLQDDVDDVINDVEDNRNVENRRSLRDDLDALMKDTKHLRDRIDTLLHPDSISNQETIVPTYAPPTPVVQPQSLQPKVVLEKFNFPMPSAAAVVEQSSVDSWKEVRPLVLLGAGIVVVISLIIFLLAMLVV